MDIRNWMKATPPEARVEICKSIGTTMDYLWQIAGRHSRPGAKFAVAFEKATNGSVMRHELRPDLWEPPHSDRAP